MGRTVDADHVAAPLGEQPLPESVRLRTLGPDTADPVLDRLSACDVVQPPRDRADLLRRLDPADRRCFALMDDEAPDEPLAFVLVALADRIEASVQRILEAPAPEVAATPDTAVFYSINRCGRRHRRLSLGPALLHRAIAELQATTTVTTFATLSPIPGFARWLEEEPSDDEELLRAGARYLLTAKRGQQPRDAVARFHLRNGARLERINLDGDVSDQGREQSFGLTANYRYEPSRLDERAARAAEGEVVASSAVRSLLRAS
ncbi:MAG: malonyl-CoA decarboxylase family protein [Actinomycetota bacterium]